MRVGQVLQLGAGPGWASGLDRVCDDASGPRALTTLSATSSVGMRLTHRHRDVRSPSRIAEDRTSLRLTTAARRSARSRNSELLRPERGSNARLTQPVRPSRARLEPHAPGGERGRELAPDERAQDPRPTSPTSDRAAQRSSASSGRSVTRVEQRLRRQVETNCQARADRSDQLGRQKPFTRVAGGRARWKHQLQRSPNPLSRAEQPRRRIDLNSDR